VTMMLKPVGAALRTLGRVIDGAGSAMQGADAFTEKLVRSTRVVRFGGKELDSGIQSFVAPTATVVGDVTMMARSSVWYGAIVRGDQGAVTIGEGSSVHDCATVSGRSGAPVVVGRDVCISAGAFVEGATLDEGCMIGMGARVLPGAHVGKDAFVDGGAVVPAGAKVEAGSLWTGNPAKPLRKLTEDEMAVLRSEAAVQAELSQVHAEQVLISENVEAFEQQDHEYEWKVAHYHDPAQPLPGFTADVQEYMKLSEPAANSGLFRAQEYLDEEAQLDREAAEAEADAAEDAYYAALGSLGRVGVAVQELAATRGERADMAAEITQMLAEEDPRAHAYLVDLAARAAAAQSEEDQLALQSEVAALDPFRDSATFELEDEVAALRMHAKAVLAAPVETAPAMLDGKRAVTGGDEDVDAAMAAAQAEVARAHKEMADERRSA